MERKEDWNYGSHGPEDPGCATIVDTATAYEPTIQWETPQEPTVAWEFDEAPEPTRYWRHGLVAVGVMTAVTAGFFLGQGVAAPEKAPRPNVPVVGTAVQSTAGPSPSIPVVLPEPPDLPPALPQMQGMQARSYSLPAPTPHTLPSPPRRTVSTQPSATTLPRVASQRAMPQAKRRPAQPETVMPPPVHLYGVRRPEPPRVVASWQVRLPSDETPRRF